MQGEGGEWPELAAACVPTGGGSSSGSRSLAAGLLGFRGAVREGGEGIKKGGFAVLKGAGTARIDAQSIGGFRWRDLGKNE